MEKISVYVGMALTHAPLEFREDFQRKLKDRLRTTALLEMLDFVGLNDGIEKEVYKRDRTLAESADLAIFICDHPSIGLGMEIAFRSMAGKRMLLLARDLRKITRFLTGFAEVEGIKFLDYQTVDDIHCYVLAEVIDISAASLRELPALT